MKVEQGEGYTKVKDEMREEEGKRRERVSGHISQQILKKKREMKRERERASGGALSMPSFFFFFLYQWVGRVKSHIFIFIYYEFSF